MKFLVSEPQVLVIFVCYEPDINFNQRIIGVDYPILIVDNSVVKSICTEIDNLNVHVISNLKNLGVAEAFNIGCKYAIANGFKWVITMDQDSNINNEIIQNLIDYKNNCNISQVAIISPRHVLQNNLESVSCDKLDSDYYSGIHTMTSGNLVNLDIFQEIGGFNSDLFIDHVDLEYYCRALSYGYKVITLNKVLMAHCLGNMRIHKLLGKSFKVYHHNTIRKYYQIRNSIVVFKKYWKTVPESKFFLKSMTFVFATTVFFEEKKFKKIYFMLQGISDGILNKLGSYEQIHKKED